MFLSSTIPPVRIKTYLQSRFNTSYEARFIASLATRTKLPSFNAEAYSEKMARKRRLQRFLVTAFPTFLLAVNPTFFTPSAGK